MNWGHQNLGDYHFFARLPEGARSLGEFPGETFDTHESFISLVSAVHESYHVMQSLVTGAGCAVVDAEDHFVEAFQQAMCSGNKHDWTLARLLATGAEYLRKHFYTSADSEYLFRRAERRSPESTAHLGGHSTVTTSHLLECHAALYTEIYICHRLTTRPKAFDMRVVEDVAADFRLESMPDRYRFPLDQFRKRMAPLMPPAEFEMAGRGHPLHRLCPQIAEYLVLAFLLDYALHIPPPVIEENNPWDLDVYAEDFDPAVRFAKLLEGLLADMYQSQLGLRSPELPEIDFHRPYDTLSPRLARWLDIGDLLGRADGAGLPKVLTPPPQKLFPLPRKQILTALKLPEVPVTFPPLGEVTELA